MARRIARISQDEIARLIKAARSAGLSIARVTFDGHEVSVIIGDKEPVQVGTSPIDRGLLAEPEL